MSASSYIATHGLDPVPMSALTPSAKGNGESALGASDTPNGQQQAATDDDGFTFWDVLDIINPLQHIPGVSTIYREVTGDQIGDVARIAGATLFGGPIGLALAGADYALKETTGGHLDEHALAMINGTTIDGSPIEDQGNSQVASAAAYYGDDTSESGSNMLAYANPTAWTANSTGGEAAPVSLIAQASPANSPAAPTPVAPTPVAQAPAAQAPTAATPQTVAQASGETVVAATGGPNTVLNRNSSHAFALDRSRDVRAPSLPVTPPRVDAFASINGPARPVQRTESPAAAPAEASPLPLGMVSAPQAAAQPPAASALPSQQAMARALQAQGLQPTNGSLPLGLFDQAQPSAAAAPAPQPAAQPSAPQPQNQTQGQPQTQAQSPVQVPAWFDQAMQKAVANYERTGSLTGTPAAVPVKPNGHSS